MLSAELQAQVLALHFGEKIGFRAIARRLKIDRKTVAEIVRRRKVRTEEERGKRDSILDPYKPLIEEFLRMDQMMPGTVILQRIRRHGYNGGISILGEYLRGIRVNPKPREAFLRLEFEPGSTAQVDWGEFGNVFGDGIKIHAFVMVLCYSRKLYVEFTQSEKFEQFIRCHENAFKFFEGVPKECWYDNLTSAVTERMGKLIRFNSRFLAYTGHQGMQPYACTPGRGNEKGRVEDSIKYLRSSFWPGRKFRDFLDLQNQAREWLVNTANPREHRSIRKIPDLVFENEEKPQLMRLNPSSYDTDEIFSKQVAPDFHVLYETNRYSVPWTLVGMSVTIRVDEYTVRIFYNEKFITRHERSYQKHKIFTDPKHMNGLMERKPGASHHAWQISSVRSLGPAMKQYLELLRAGNRSLRVEAKNILALATVYGETHVHDAVEELLKTGVIGSDNIELLLKKKVPNNQELNPAPMNFRQEKLNRILPVVDLRTYDEHLFREHADKGEPTDG